MNKKARQLDLKICVPKENFPVGLSRLHRKE